jgi:hypothetical protein
LRVQGGALRMFWFSAARSIKEGLGDSPIVERSARNLGRLSLTLQHAGFDQAVDQIAHGVEGREESFQRHAHTLANLHLAGGAFGWLHGHQFEAHDARGEIHPADGVGENFRSHSHPVINGPAPMVSLRTPPVNHALLRPARIPLKIGI